MRRKLILLNSAVLLLGALALTAQTPAPLSPNAQKISDACVAMGGAKLVCDQDAILHELAITGETAYKSTVSAQFTADEAKEAADIAALKSSIVPGPAGKDGTPGAPGPQGIQGIQGIPGPAGSGPSMFGSASILAITPAFGTAPKLDYASCIPPGRVVGWTPQGMTMDVDVVVPAAGNYTLTSCLSSQGQGVYHYESPAGTKIGSSLTALATDSWHSYALQDASAAVALNAGHNTVRFVLETGSLNWGGVQAH